MAKYDFRLQTLLKLRIARRDRCRLELAEAYQAESLLNEKIEQLRQQMRGARSHSQEAVKPGSVNVDALLGARRYELLLQTQAAVLDRHGRQLAAEIERRREAVASADREVRILEKLREKQYANHRFQESRAEMKQIDEVAHRQYVRLVDKP